LLGWRPPRAYQIWHDRAVFHFLTSSVGRAAYLARWAALPGGGIILATCTAGGPEYCPGRPTARYDVDGLAAMLTAAYGEAAAVTGRYAGQHRTPAGASSPSPGSSRLSRHFQQRTKALAQITP
jgi:hypothetical protein